MPVETRGSFRAKRAALAGILAVLLAVGVIILIGWLARTGVVRPNSGDGYFRAGRIETIRDAIAQGGPILFPDPLGGDRQRILNHIGTDPGAGWYAFDARRPGAPSECLLRYQPAAKGFTDTCDGEFVEPDGRGLVQYKVRLREGRVEVNFGTPLPAGEG